MWCKRASCDDIGHHAMSLGIMQCHWVSWDVIWHHVHLLLKLGPMCTVPLPTTGCPKKSVPTSELLVGLADKLTNIAPEVWTLFLGHPVHCNFLPIIRELPDPDDCKIIIYKCIMLFILPSKILLIKMIVKKRRRSLAVATSTHSTIFDIDKITDQYTVHLWKWI